MTRQIAAAAAFAAAILLAKAAKLETLHEGRRTHVYDDRDGSPLDNLYRRMDNRPCKGHPTVGIGCNLDRPNARMALASVGADYDAVRRGAADLTAPQIDTLFAIDLQSAVRQAERDVPAFDELPEVVQLVLIDMTFNMGSVHGFPGMLGEIAIRNWTGMIREMIDSKWYREDVQPRAKHDIELLRSELGIGEHAQDLTDEERAKVLAMVAITTDRTIGEMLAATEAPPPPEHEA